MWNLIAGSFTNGVLFRSIVIRYCTMKRATLIKELRRHKANVRCGTKQGRKQLMRILEEDKIGACSIENVKLSDAKEWALRMKEKGYSFKTINNHKRSLKAAFYTAIQDDCIRKNQFDFQLNTVLEDNTEPKETP